MNTQGLYQWTNRVDIPGYTRNDELNNSIHEYPRINQSEQPNIPIETNMMISGYCLLLKLHLNDKMK